MKWPLAILVAVLGAIVGLEWLGWPPSPPQQDGDDTKTSAPGASATQAQKNPLDVLAPLEDKGQYAVIMERPLFLPDRRPPEEEPEEADPQTPEPDVNLSRIDLNAVLITPKETLAWVRDPAEKELVELHPGDELHGWTVKEIQGDRLVLERQGETDTLILRDYKNAPPPMPGASPRLSTAGRDGAAGETSRTAQRRRTREQEPMQSVPESKRGVHSLRALRPFAVAALCPS